MIRKSLLISILIIMSCGSSIAANVVFVQSHKARLYVIPNLSSEPILTLSRGEKLTVMQEQGRWYQVSFAGKTGWIYKYSVASKPVISSDKLLQKLPQQESGKARRLPSSTPTTAVIRGLDEPEDKSPGQSGENQAD